MKDQVKDYASIGCPNDEIAILLGITVNQLVKDYSDELDLGRALLNSKIRRIQVQEAENGDKTMLTWLGKNIIGQSDKVDSNIITSTSFADDMDSEKLERILKEMEKDDEST